MPTKPLQNQAVPVAWITTELRVGGAERAIVNLATHLDTLRYRSHVISLAEEPVGERAQLVSRLQAARIDVSFLNLRHAWQIQRGRDRLRAELERIQPRCLVSFLFHANVLSRVALGDRNCAHVMGIRVADPRVWRTRIERRVAQAADAIVCVSQRVADHCRLRGYPESLLQVIPNGIDLDGFDGAASEPWPITWESDRPTIGIIGRLDRQKGSHSIPELAKRVWHRVPEAVIVIAGDGPYARRLRTWAERQSPQRVVWVGWTPQPARLLRTLDVLALPSQWEGMPNIVLEAMAAQRPVVAFDVEGLPELLPDQPAAPSPGLQRVPSGDLDSFAARIAQLITNKQLATGIGIANRERVARQWTLPPRVKAYEHVLDGLLQTR